MYNQDWQERVVHRNPDNVLLTLLMLGAAGGIVWYMVQQGIIKMPDGIVPVPGGRSEERRVGKECRL